MVKETFAKGVSKAVPILGEAISGGLTLATFKPMAHRLQKHLSTIAHMSPEKFSKYEAAIVDVEDSDIDGETVEVVIEEAGTNCWVCTCGAENKGKFCTECGRAKPAGIPQYKCDKCNTGRFIISGVERNYSLLILCLLFVITTPVEPIVTICWALIPEVQKI